MPNVIPANVPVDIYITKTLDNVADLLTRWSQCCQSMTTGMITAGIFCSPPYTRRGR